MSCALSFERQTAISRAVSAMPWVGAPEIVGLPENQGHLLFHHWGPRVSPTNNQPATTISYLHKDSHIKLFTAKIPAPNCAFRWFIWASLTQKHFTFEHSLKRKILNRTIWTLSLFLLFPWIPGKNTCSSQDSRLFILFDKKKLQNQKNYVIFLPSKTLQFHMRDPEIIAMLSEAILFAREQPLAWQEQLVFSTIFAGESKCLSCLPRAYPIAWSVPHGRFCKVEESCKMTANAKQDGLQTSRSVF